MTFIDQARERVNTITKLALKHDGYPEDTFDADFTPTNPWLPLLRTARRNLAEHVMADEKHGALVVKDLKRD